MARYTAADCRRCRREGVKLFLKGNKCMTDKCSLNKRAFAPGQHGKNRIKLSDYGVQLREKQKAKRIYGILEHQFRRYFEKAATTKGVTGETLLQLLERRLDNVVHHLKLGSSRSQARQFVRYGHIYVNGHRVTIPSYQLKANDAVRFKGRDAHTAVVKNNIETAKDKAIPKWLTPDEDGLGGKILRLPVREDIALPIKEQLIVELYSK